MAEEKIESKLNQYTNVQVELDVLGCLYKFDDLYQIYAGKLSDKDFTDARLVFFYTHLCAIKNKFTRGTILDKTRIDHYFSCDPDLIEQYRVNGGFKFVNNMMQLASIKEAFVSNLETLKKYTLIREYLSNGIDIPTMIANHSNYKNPISLDNMSSQDIYDFLSCQVKNTKLEIMQPISNNNLGHGISDLPKLFLRTPRQGINMPFPVLSKWFLGLRTQKVMGIGMLSNLGKTRMLVNFIAHTALIENKKCLLLVNEMTEEDVKLCLLMTVLNEEIYRPLYVNLYNDSGEKVDPEWLSIDQKSISVGSYKRDNGSIITRQELSFDETNINEVSFEEYYDYVNKNSKQFRDIVAVSKWLEEQIQGKIFIKDVCGDYRDNRLAEEITLAHEVDGVDFFFYDTMKSYDEGHNSSQSSYRDLIGTSERFKFLANSLNIFIGFTFQLTDDSTYVNAVDLSSMNIASSKHVKHNVDSLILANRIKNEEELIGYNYISIEDKVSRRLDPSVLKDSNTNYYVFKVDKNRDGLAQQSVLVKVDLGKNIWTELGIIQLNASYHTRDGGFKAKK